MAASIHGVKRAIFFDLLIRLFTVFILVLSALMLPTHIVRGDESTPPAAPEDLSAVTGDAEINLSWSANMEADLAGYNIYRGTVTGVYSPTPINGGTLISESDTTYHDETVSNGTTYYYVITAVDDYTNESGDSNEASATPANEPPAAPED